MGHFSTEPTQRFVPNMVCWFFLVLVQACSHPLEIVGQGDIISASGTRNCSLEQYQAADAACTVNLVVGVYQETYRGIPRDGWQFARWEGCGDQHPNCNLDIPADIVNRYWGSTAVSLRAVFSKNTSSQVVTIHPEETVYAAGSIPKWPFSSQFPAGPDWPADAFISTLKFKGMKRDELVWVWPSHNYFQTYTGTLENPRKMPVAVSEKNNYYEFWKNAVTDDASRTTPLVTDDVSGFFSLISVPTIPPTFVPVMTEKRVIAKLKDQPDHDVSKYGLVWIQSIYKVSETTLLGFTHNESFDVNNQYVSMVDLKERYYSVGLAISKDAGFTWYFLGEIIKSNTYDQLDEKYQNNINGGVYAVVGDFFYSYFLETASNSGAGRHISVARARITDVVEAALEGSVTDWHKYNGNNTWATTNALAGLGASITQERSPKAITIDHHKPVVLSSLAETPYLLITWENFQPGNETRIYLHFSKDGLDYNPQNGRTRMLVRGAQEEFINWAFFVAIENASDDGSVISGKEFYIYYTMTSITDGKWDFATASLRRSRVSLD